MVPTFFKSPADLRAWLAKHHDSVPVLLIGFYKKQSNRGGITYSEALDQALCFGWIDGVRKSVDDVSYTIRFTPRKPKSNWSAVNVKRFGELKKLGLVQPPGDAAFAVCDPKKAKQYSYERETSALDAAHERQFRANAKAWAFFQAQPPGYRKVASFYVVSAKQEATRLRRLERLIADSEAGRRIGLLQRPDKASGDKT